MDDLDRMMNEIGNMNSIGDADSLLGGHTNSLRYKGINFKMLIAAFIDAIAAWIIDLGLYTFLKDNLPRPLLIGIVFALLGLMLAIVLMIFGEDSGNDVSKGWQLVGVIAGPILLLLCASLFQFIYQLTLKEAVVEPTSYVFVIDDSGSMKRTDPSGQRYDSIETILKDKPENFPFMIYGFSDTSYIIRDMAPKSDGMEPIAGKNHGDTAIGTTLKNVINDYANGVWKGGRLPKVILLTDGYASDIVYISEMDDTLKRYRKHGISISCVGLGGNVGEELMEQIAGSTNGVFIDVNDVSQLTQAMQSAATGFNETERDLVSKRLDGNGILYGLLRILFLVLLGALLGIIKYFAYGDADSAKTLIGISVITSAIGAVLMEGGTALGIPAIPLWLILWLLYSVALADKSMYIQSNIIQENSFM